MYYFYEAHPNQYGSIEILCLQDAMGRLFLNLGHLSIFYDSAEFLFVGRRVDEL
jgi:hypothetical protein